MDLGFGWESSPQVSRSQPARLQPVWQSANSGRPLDPPYPQAPAQQEGIDRLLTEYGVVALVAPSGSPASVLRPDGTQGPGPIPPGPRSTRPASLTATAAVAGYPLISVPMGLVDGLPVGLSFVGTAWSEALLISVAYDYEQGSLARIPPPMALTSPRSIN